MDESSEYPEDPIIISWRNSRSPQINESSNPSWNQTGDCTSNVDFNISAESNSDNPKSNHQRQNSSKKLLTSATVRKILIQQRMAYLNDAQLLHSRLIVNNILLK